jgi:hypothetical protein
LNTVAFSNSSTGKGVGSPISTAKKISPTLYISVFLGWHLSGSCSARSTAYISGAINMIEAVFIVWFSVCGTVHFDFCAAAIQRGLTTGSNTKLSEPGPSH